MNHPRGVRPAFKQFRYEPGIKAVYDLANTKRLVIVNGDKVIGPNMENTSSRRTHGRTAGRVRISDDQRADGSVGSDYGDLFRSSQRKTFPAD